MVFLASWVHIVSALLDISLVPGFHLSRPLVSALPSLVNSFSALSSDPFRVPSDPISRLTSSRVVMQELTLELPFPWLV